MNSGDEKETEILLGRYTLGYGSVSHTLQEITEEQTPPRESAPVIGNLRGLRKQKSPTKDASMIETSEP
jgi:hypothetical protein